MISLYEGVVINTTPEEMDHGLINVMLADEMAIVNRVQMPLINGNQERLPIGARVLFYKNSDMSAKFIKTISDPPPIKSPVWKETSEMESVGDPSLAFQPGDYACGALGNSNSILPTRGSTLWLKNSGDAFLYSGSRGHYLSVSDSTGGVEALGSEVLVHQTGNAVYTQALYLSTNLVGLPEVRLGTRYTNPTAQLINDGFISGIHITPSGSINLGIEDPTGLTLLSGISWDAILGGAITLRSATTLSIQASSTSIVSGSISLTAASISLVGTMSLLGSSSVTGNLSVTGLVSITNPIAFKYTGTIVPPPPSLAALGVTSMIPVNVGAVVKFLLLV